MRICKAWKYIALLLDGGGLGGGAASELTQGAEVGADLNRRLIALLTPPSRPSSIEEEGEVNWVHAFRA
jgi:hypothetical protein